MTLDRKELKIQALRERVASLTTEYEDRIADLRVELTCSTQEKDEQIAALRTRIAELEESARQDTTVVEGEVVSSEEEE